MYTEKEVQATLLLFLLETKLILLRKGKKQESKFSFDGFIISVLFVDYNEKQASIDQ